jgi:hypothetical protein
VSAFAAASDPPSWFVRFGSTELGTTWQCVAGRSPTRKTLTLLNAGAGTVYLSHVENPAASERFPLVAGAALTIATTGDVWALGPGTVGLVVEDA